MDSSKPSSFQKAVHGYSLKAFADNYQGKVGVKTIGNPLQASFVSAIKYLEKNCNCVYALQSEVSDTESLHDAKESIPTIFDSAFLLPLFNGLPIHHSVFSSIVNLIVENRCDDGLWSYFHKDFDGILPPDVDTTVCCLEALVTVGFFNENQALDTFSKIYETIKIYEDGLVDTYFPRSSSHSPFAICQLRKTKRRIDIGVTCVLIRIMGKFKRDHISDLVPSFKLIETALDAMLNNDESNDIWTNYANYYTNWDVICYLISSTIRVSTVGKSMFTEKLIRVIKSRLCCDKRPIYMACRIMTALNVDLQDVDLLLQEVKSLVKTQNNVDNSFPADCFYLGSSIFFFGSKVTSTGLVVAAMGMLKRKFPNIEELLQSV